MEASVKTMVNLLKRNEPASATSLDSLVHSCRIQLPKDYLEFLGYSDGAAGTFPSGNHVILWRAERLVERNEAYEVEAYAPGIFIFGSSGGGEAYGFDTRSSMSVVQVPFVGMDLNEVEPVAPSFTEFLAALADPCDNG
jgi:hypothetical protein